MHRNGHAIAASPKRHQGKAEARAREGRTIQRTIDRSDRKRGGAKPKSMQAGARIYPAPPLPKQHLKKPGSEADLELKPMYDAPHYKGSDKLLNKAALITGGDSGIGRAVAVLFAREGADVAVVYLNEHGDAEDTRRLVAQEGRRCLLISGDVGDEEFCRTAVARTLQEFGHLDIVVNNAAEQHPQESIEKVTAEQLERTFRTNIFSQFYTVK